MSFREAGHDYEHQNGDGEDADIIRLGARRSKASDDEESLDGDDDYQDKSTQNDRSELGINLPDNLEDGEVDQVDEQAPKQRPKLEPYVVPTSGAFYMHDDRFDEEEEMAKAKVVRKSPAEEDERWVHDKFESLDLEDGARSPPPAYFGFRRGRGRGRGRSRRNSPPRREGRDDRTANAPPGFDGPNRNRVDGRPHPADVLRSSNSYSPPGYSHRDDDSPSDHGPRSQSSLKPDAKPFHSKVERGGRGGRGRVRDGAHSRLDPSAESFQPALAEYSYQGGGPRDDGERRSRGRGGGRRYSAMAGNLAGS